MGWRFVAAEDARAYVAVLDAAERAVVVEAVDEVVELLGGEQAGGQGEHPLESIQLGGTPVPAPDDPALLRLLPDVSREDPEVAAEFRRLTEEDLRATKVAQLLRLRAALQGHPEVVVVPSEAPAVAAALTDLRLVIAERLGIRDEADADAVHRLVQTVHVLDPADGDAIARAYLATVYTMLSLLQETLVELMLDALPDDGVGP